MTEALQSLGHDVSFLHLQQPLRFPDGPLRAFWGDRLHVYRGGFPAGWIRRSRHKILRVTAKTLHFNLPVDAYYDPAVGQYLAALFDRRPFDVVLLTYVFYSRLLESLPPGVHKLIDTQDVFSDRYRLYDKHGQAREFFSTSPEEEGKALDRADTVIAIQEGDARHFRSIGHTPVRVVGDLAPPLADIERSGSTAVEPAMLFVGGPMGINLHGIRWFMEDVLPLVRSQVPNAELWLVGGICDRIGRPGPGVRAYGFVESPEDFYRRAALVINPQRFGTGLSIKSVDALRRGRPLVTTASGARGLEVGAGTAFLQGESPEEFARHVVAVLRDPAQAELGEAAWTFAREYHRKNLEALAKVVSGGNA